MTTSRLSFLKWRTVITEGNLRYYFFGRSRKAAERKAHAFLEVLS